MLLAINRNKNFYLAKNEALNALNNKNFNTIQRWTKYDIRKSKQNYAKSIKKSNKRITDIRNVKKIF